MQSVILVFVRPQGDQCANLTAYGVEGAIQAAEALLTLAWGTTTRAEVWNGDRLEWQRDRPEGEDAAPVGFRGSESPVGGL